MRRSVSNVVLLVFLPLFSLGQEPVMLPKPTDIPVQCQGKRDSGSHCHSAPSDQPVQMFYFDSVTGVCQPFYYEGCYGNGNRFATATECREKCLSASSEKKSACPMNRSPLFAVNEGSVKIPANCGTDGNNDCPEGYSCNANVCCPVPETLCKLPRHDGTVGSAQTAKANLLLQPRVQAVHALYLLWLRRQCEQVWNVHRMPRYVHVEQ